MQLRLVMVVFRIVSADRFSDVAFGSIPLHTNFSALAKTTWLGDAQSYVRQPRLGSKGLTAKRG